MGVPNSPNPGPKSTGPTSHPRPRAAPAPPPGDFVGTAPVRGPAATNWRRTHELAARRGPARSAGTLFGPGDAPAGPRGRGPTGAPVRCAWRSTHRAPGECPAGQVEVTGTSGGAGRRAP